MNLDKPSVPVIYAQILLKMVEERGYDAQAIMDGLDFKIPRGAIRGVTSRISINQHIQLIRRTLDQAEARGINSDGFGFEFGLQFGLSTHGILGFAALSQINVQRAIELFIRFIHLVVPVMDAELRVKGDVAIIDMKLDMRLPADLHHLFYDMMAAAIWKSALAVIVEPWPGIEFWFDYPQPASYERYRLNLPPSRFDTGVNQIHFPAKYLGRHLRSGDPISAADMEAQCRRDLELLGNSDNIVSQVKALLRAEHSGYPNLEQIGATLFMSTRTLKRKLQNNNTSFLVLLEETKREEAEHLLSNSALPIEQISARLGYNDPANFSNAFRKWTGVSPSAWRRQQQGKPD